MSERESFVLFGSFFSLVLLTPLLGSLLADRVLGQMRGVLCGVALSALGYALLLLHQRATLYVALFALVVGYGFIKPTLPAVLANRYTRLSVRREVAFIMFYWAVELGAFLAPLATEAVRVRAGFTGNFAMSAVAMILAALALVGGRRGLGQPQPPTRAEAEPGPRWSALLIVFLLWTLHELVTSVLTRSLPLFTRAHVDLTLGGQLPDPLFALLVNGSGQIAQAFLAPLVVLGLLYLERRRAGLSVVARIAVGMVLMVLPCLLLLGASLEAKGGQRVSGLWVLAAHLASALPGVALLPMVLALVSQLVPARHLSTAFGLWFVLSGLSTKAVGALASTYDRLSEPVLYGGLALISLISAALWISQVHRLEAEQGLADMSSPRPALPV